MTRKEIVEALGFELFTWVTKRGYNGTAKRFILDRFEATPRGEYMGQIFEENNWNMDRLVIDVVKEVKVLAR